MNQQTTSTPDATTASITPGIWEHYKGPRYYVLGLSKDTETGQIYVVYRPLYDTDWSHLVHRPLDMFMETVTVDGQVRPRFRLVAS